jgi:hypothetical protein
MRVVIPPVLNRLISCCVIAAAVTTAFHPSLFQAGECAKAEQLAVR